MRSKTLSILILLLSLALAACQDAGFPARDVVDASVSSDDAFQVVPESTPIEVEVNYGKAVVDSIDILILELFPVQINVIVHGILSDGCTTIDEITVERFGGTFEITMTTARPVDAACTEALVPFEKIVPLDVFGLSAGKYRVTVNGVSDAFELSVDNVLNEPTPTPIPPTATPEPVVDAERGEIQRELDVSGENVEILDVERYFSLYRYGSTLKIYNVRDQNTVIKISISNESTDFDMSVVINIFEESESEESIGKWINNQHSDGILPDAPQPVGVYTLPEQSFLVTSYSLVDHTTEEFGDEYDNYVVEIYVDTVSEEGVYSLKGFVAEAAVHIRTKDINNEMQ